MLKSLRFWLGLAVSAIFLVLLFRSAHFGELKDALHRADYIWLLPAFLVYLVGVAVRSIRWRILMGPLRKTTARRLFPLMIIGYMANNLLPLRAGELVRAWATGERENVSKAGALGTIGVERLMDGSVLVILLIVSGAIVGLDSTLSALAIAASALFVVAIIGFALFTRTEERAKRIAGLFIRMAPRRFQHRLEEMASSLIIGMRSIHSVRPLLAVIVLSFSAWLIEVCTYLLVGIGFHLEASYADFVLLTTAANLAVLLPATAGGVGPFEWASKQVLIGSGVSSSLATAYAVTSHALVLVPVTMLGLYFVWATKLNFSRLIRADREVIEAPQPHLIGPEHVAVEPVSEPRKTAAESRQQL